ncbi:helix-turn-helix DNA binding domain protein [Rhodococcus phage WC1]|uniref:Helix-turn-helix DNA-binding domain protein n=1 Tax=Rhodococcus phage CosmicSans TaxID=1701851 RepID=A0A0K2CM03_9CAUD|nr:HTH DNA binding protein [Rhodococcus phage CosmicSans]ALA46240.1 hypothetical protein PBI_RHODALYSA_37 [Rhodococcus phage Rhodalysa]ALN97081.1 helix-turn-helix DNA-binding domain protein [Rhodococcus phage TWAMP]ALO80635.1 helix-turn-helix DNA-binding domain protein [Rhodococcus phage Lillie]AOQ27486.1 helix-turn-helix DNA-binding domain protein [Rhodococcus phage Natosaleda]ASR84484.1 helix-turn-helix DNA-binding domain protein [Rhodococcus phage RexFury]AWY04049.1 helix-turn-helix DNA-bi
MTALGADLDLIEKYEEALDSLDMLHNENNLLKAEIRQLKAKFDNRPKLSPQDVRDIRLAHKRKEASTAELADMFGVNRATIYRTVIGAYH